jgi:glycosyltransferase involved in cell wall biosynthesis
MARALNFVGPLPPPVDGQAVVTEFLLRALERHGAPPTVLDIGAGPGRGVAALLRRSARLLGVVARLAADVVARRRGLTYLSLNANRGMYVSAFMAGLARVAGHRIVIHHHTAGHLDQPRRAMRLVGRLAGGDAVHVCICASMAERLVAAYGPSVRRTGVLSNIVILPVVAPPVARDDRDGRPLVLGHMSNLSFEKGVKRAVETLLTLRERGTAARLLLAGPCQSDEVRAYVEQTRARHGGIVDYLGPVYDEAKRRFFETLDVFLFPTAYPNETQGIVNLEAMAHGVPTVAYARCCIASDVGHEGGLAVPGERPFAPEAAAWIARELDTAARRAAWRTAAHARSVWLRENAGRQLDDLLDLLAGTAEH